MNKFFLAVIVLIGLTGCVSTQSLPPIDINIADSYDRVWDNIVKIVTIEYGLHVQTSDKASGLLVTDWVAYERPPLDFNEHMMVDVYCSPFVKLHLTV